ncbi:MAG: hypothetical protein ACPL1F_07995, partial [bacterium]
MTVINPRYWDVSNLNKSIDSYGRLVISFPGDVGYVFDNYGYNYFYLTKNDLSITGFNDAIVLSFFNYSYDSTNNITLLYFSLFSHRDVSIDLTQYKYLIWKGDILRYKYFPVRKNDNNLHLEGVIRTRGIDYINTTKYREDLYTEKTILVKRLPGNNYVNFLVFDDVNVVYNISINQTLVGSNTYTYTLNIPPLMILKGLTFEFTTNNSANANFIYQYKIEISYNNGTTWNLLQDFKKGIIYGISGATHIFQHYFPVNAFYNGILKYNQNFVYRITIQKTAPTTED